MRTRAASLAAACLVLPVVLAAAPPAGSDEGSGCTRFTHANGISLAYRDLGDPGAPPVLLVMGLAGQLVDWPDAFVEGLLDAGFRVILFDNRDVGLSEKLHAEGDPSLAWAVLKSWVGLPVGAPYTLGDMADDTVALLDDRGVESAHVVGASMGGMIGQVLALEHPERARSLVSIMSSSGAAGLPEPDPEVLELLREERPEEREAAIERAVRVQTALAGPVHPPDPERLREHAARSWDRSHYAPGVKRQLLAILAAEPRAERLRALRLPTLVVHGTADPLIPPDHGEDAAKRIPGARLVLVEGMGHGMHWLTELLLARVTDAVVEHLRRVEAGRT